MIIELYGLPASGKTTLARKIARNTDFKIVEIKSKPELIYFNFLYLIKHPIKFIITLFYIILNSPNWNFFYQKFMNTFLQVNARYQKALRYKLAIIDQGYFQNIISVFEKEISSKILIRYIKFLLFPDKLIVFNISKNKRLKLMGERGYFARDKFGKAYRKKWEKIIEKNDKILKDNLRKINTDCLMVKDKDINNSFKDVVGEIKKIIKTDFYQLI